MSAASPKRTWRCALRGSVSPRLAPWNRLSGWHRPLSISDAGKSATVGPAHGAFNEFRRGRAFRPRLLQSIKHYFRRLRAAHRKATIEDETWHAADTQLARLCFVRA